MITINPLITVIVPVYNVEKYLEQCVKSLISQTYNNIEIILIDDGSEDSSSKICDFYQSIDSRIKVIHKKNAGLGIARNTGIEIMQGEYVTFVDADDYVDKLLIEDLYIKILENKVDVCKGGFIRITNQQEIRNIRKYKYEIFYGKEAVKDYLPRLIGSSPDKKDSIEMCVCGTLFKSSIILDYRIRFPSERELISEDLIFNIQYMQHSNGALLIDSTYYLYRINPASLTQSYRADRFEASCYLYNYVKEKLLELKYDDLTFQRLRRIFFINLRGCLKQEKKTISGLKWHQSYSNIKRICENKLVQQIISEYPIQKLGLKQRLFLYMVKYECVMLLYFCL